MVKFVPLTDPDNSYGSLSIGGGLTLMRGKSIYKYTIRKSRRCQNRTPRNVSLFFKLTTGYDISVVVVESVEIATNQVLFHAMWFKSFFIRDSIFSSSIHGVPTAIVIGFACSLKVSLGRGGVEPNILSTSNIIMSIIYTFLFCEILFSLSDEKRKSLNLDAFSFFIQFWR